MNLIWILVGLSVGSFLNGLSFRATNDKPLFTKRSTCSVCGKCIAWYDLIPVVSWILLKGKCRHCDKKIPFNYIVVEMFVGLLTYLLFKDTQVTLVSIAQYAFVISFFLNVLTDATSFTVYDPFLYIMIGCSTFFALLRGEIFVSLYSGLVAVLMIAIVSFLVLIIVKKPAMGSGDYFVFFALGMTISSANFFDLLLFSSILGIVVSLVFRKNKLPFFPLLFFGYIFVLFGGKIL